MGIPYGQPIPKQGNEVRYYTAPGDLHTGDIININHDDRICTVSTSINLRTITHTSTTAKMTLRRVAKHVVVEGTTYAERDVCNRHASIVNACEKIDKPAGVHSITPANSSKEPPQACMIRHDGKVVNISLDHLLQQYNLTEKIKRKTQRYSKGKSAKRTPARRRRTCR